MKQKRPTGTAWQNVQNITKNYIFIEVIPVSKIKQNKWGTNGSQESTPTELQNISQTGYKVWLPCDNEVEKPDISFSLWQRKECRICLLYTSDAADE